MPPTSRPEPSHRDDPRKPPPASIESDKDPRNRDPRDEERRRVGPEDEDRSLRDGEKRPFGQMP